MKLLMLLENEFPPDERVEKEIHTLCKEGYKIHLVCPTRQGKPSYEDHGDYEIFRFPIGKVMYKLSALVLILPFYLNRWTRFVKKLNIKNSYDAVHVHDLPLSSVGLRLKGKYGMKLICDQHEYYSNWIVDTAHYNTFTGRMVKAFSNWKKYERKALKQADLVITVEEPLRQQYLKEYGLDEKRIIILPNTPNKDVFHKSNVDSQRFKEYKENFMLLYFGGIDILRGIDNVIRAIPEIIKEIPNFKFVFAGKIYGGYDPLKTARDLGVSDYVDFIGWLDLKGLPSLISESDLGVFIPPSHRTEINKTIATKNYQFLVMNKPMMVGKAKYMKEFTEENQIGFSVDEENPEEISRRIIEFVKNPEQKETIIKKCQTIGASYYWEQTSISLTKAYKQLISVN